MGPHLGHKFIGYCFVILKADLSSSEGPLKEEPQGQLRQLCLDQSADGLVSKRENLLAFLLPFVILEPKKLSNYPKFKMNLLTHTYFI